MAAIAHPGQTLAEHLLAVALFAKGFGRKLGFDTAAELAGLLWAVQNFDKMGRILVYCIAGHDWIGRVTPNGSRERLFGWIAPRTPPDRRKGHVAIRDQLGHRRFNGHVV
jgi:uncharacterized membrane protein YgdD (TMEM256/DUF423 family)